MPDFNWPDVYSSEAKLCSYRSLSEKSDSWFEMFHRVSTGSNKYSFMKIICIREESDGKSLNIVNVAITPIVLKSTCVYT